ncbi:MAG: DUF3810 domain-containing protein [Bacteroidota bacterium]
MNYWKNGYQRTRLYIAILLPIQIIVFSWFKQNQNWVENIYIKLIYNQFSLFLRIITGFFEISIGLILMYCFLLFILYKIIKNIVNLTRKHLKLKDFFLNTICTLSILYGFYMLSWGLAYYRKPIATINQLNIENIDFEEIKTLAENLIILTNESRSRITNEEARSSNIKQYFGIAKIGYDNISREIPELTYQKPSIKIGFNQTILSYLSAGGIYSFPTGEANVNAINSAFEAPFTICHEMAHQLGFASEEEANYISFLACTHNPKPIFRYSAYSEALSYTLSNIYRQDSTLYLGMKSKIDTNVLADFAFAKAKWKPYQIPFIRKTSSYLYDIFLKSNDQEEGIKSYGLVVELLVGEMRKKKAMSDER